MLREMLSKESSLQLLFSTLKVSTVWTQLKTSSDATWDFNFQILKICQDAGSYLRIELFRVGVETRARIYL